MAAPAKLDKGRLYKIAAAGFTGIIFGKALDAYGIAQHNTALSSAGLILVGFGLLLFVVGLVWMMAHDLGAGAKKPGAAAGLATILRRTFLFMLLPAIVLTGLILVIMKVNGTL